VSSLRGVAGPPWVRSRPVGGPVGALGTLAVEALLLVVRPR